MNNNFINDDFINDNMFEKRDLFTFIKSLRGLNESKKKKFKSFKRQKFIYIINVILLFKLRIKKQILNSSEAKQ